MRATWNNTVIAESDDTIVIEGNHYFPKESLNQEYFTSTDSTTTCPWKGLASYFTVEVYGKSNPDAAWTYVEPLPAAQEIAGYVAFWKGVTVSD